MNQFFPLLRPVRIVWPLLLFTLLFIEGCRRSSEGLRVESLRCEYASNPLGIDELNPRLSWCIADSDPGTVQTAYRILVASSPEMLYCGEGDLWDTGKVLSEQSQSVRYSGIALHSNQACYWKVQVWDAHDRASSWSTPARWSMGVLDANDWYGEWISNRWAPVSSCPVAVAGNGEWGPSEYSSPDTVAVYLRKEIELEKGFTRATAHICGLGYYELYLSGEKVGQAVMDPAFSDYHRTAYYATYDVTSVLKRGTNAIGVILGNGFYNTPTPDAFQFESAHWKTPPKLLMNLIVEYPSGNRLVVATDSSWRWDVGEISFNCIRGGETIDHTRTQSGWNAVGFDASDWNVAVTVPPPAGILRAQVMPPMKVRETIAPVAITEPRPGVYVADFGKKLTGWIALETQGRTGQEVVCNYNEMLRKDGTVDTTYSHTHTRGRFQQERLILAGESLERFEPRFTYHGFRYVELRGLAQRPTPESIRAKSVHTALDTTGRFNCSDPVLTNLFRAVERTLLNSAHGLIAEEATREKMGWTLDNGVAVESYLYNFDAINTIRKVIQDYIDSPEPSGHIPSILPTDGWSYALPDGMPMYWDDPWWGGSIFLIMERLYTWTGDISLVEKAFETMRRYVDYVAWTAKNDLVYWSLGDWLDGAHDGLRPGLTPVVQTSTAGYAWMTRRVSEYARLLGRDDLAAEYAIRAERITKNFNSAFLDRRTGSYHRGSQTAQVLPLYLGLVPDDMKALVEARLLDEIAARDGHTTTGFIGSVPMLEYLSENGYMDVAFAMVDKRDSPGWLHMVEDSLSVMGEDLVANRYGSGHHPYGAHIGFWLFKYLGGIRPDPAHPGFHEFILEPYFPASIDHLNVTTQSGYGPIRSTWQREADKITLELTVPGNSFARLILPANYRVETAPIDADGVPGVAVLTALDDGRQQTRLFPGTWRFLLME